MTNDFKIHIIEIEKAIKSLKENKQGIEQEKRNIINKFLEKGMKIEEISKLLELSKEEIEKILKC